jgi:hypothetical protein
MISSLWGMRLVLGGLGVGCVVLVAACSGRSSEVPAESRGGGGSSHVAAGAAGGSAPGAQSCGGVSFILGDDVARPPVPDGAGIEPGALEGCRSPESACCATCYFERDGMCQSKSTGAFNGQDVIYTGFGLVGPAPCPAGSRCASCSLQEERELRERQAENCTCDFDPGIDPCLGGGCACACSRLAVLTKACPELAQ